MVINKDALFCQSNNLKRKTGYGALLHQNSCLIAVSHEGHPTGESCMYTQAVLAHLPEWRVYFPAIIQQVCFILSLGFVLK